MMLRNIILAIAIIGGSFLGYRYFAGQGHQGGFDPMAQMPPAAVSIAAVATQEIQEFKEFSGRLEAIDKAEIRPRITGTIDAVHFQEGSMVKKGDLLFTIDPRPFAAEVARAEAAIAAAATAAEFAATEAERARNLIKNNTVSQRVLDAKENDSRTAEANLQAAQAALRTAKLNLDYARITAPISGRISRAEITVGNLVESGLNAPVLTTIVTSSPIYASIDMDEQTFLKYVREQAINNDKSRGIPVNVYLADKEQAPLAGSIKSFDNQLNATSGTIRVRAIVDNKDGSLVPGMFVQVQVGAATMRSVALITDRAIGTDQSKKFVYVVGDDKMPIYREVTLGNSFNGMRVIESGLQPGEKIIINGLQHVRPGVPVAPEEVTMGIATMTTAPTATAATSAPETSQP
jgi:membrane fusion protein, multidrug efflux system